jgi:AcrR family transcriptional regulator
MRQIAEAAGVSKALLYHYFPNKIELFKAAVQEHAGELQRITEPSGEGTPIEQLSETLDGYLAWIEHNAETWAKLVQSATNLPEAREVVQGFRATTLEHILVRLTGKRSPPPALRTALQGWLGYIDAAILDWVHNRDLTREQLRIFSSPPSEPHSSRPNRPIPRFNYRSLSRTGVPGATARREIVVR